MDDTPVRRSDSLRRVTRRRKKPLMLNRTEASWKGMSDKIVLSGEYVASTDKKIDKW